MTIARTPPASGGEDLLVGMFRELGQIVWLLAPDGGVLQFNSAWTAYTGLSTETSGLSWADVFHPHDRDRLIAARTRGIASGAPYEVEARMRRFDGAYRRHLCRVKPIYEEGRLDGWLGTAIDVEDLRHADDLHRHAEARQQALLQLGAALRGLSAPDEITATGAEILARVLGAVRAGYAAVDTAQGLATITNDWVADPIGRRSAGVYRVSDWGDYLSPLMAGETVAVSDVMEDPRTARSAAGWAEWGIRAAAFVPLLRAGELVAYMFIHADGVRRWKPEELDFVRSVADRIWAALDAAALSAEARELLTSAIEASPEPIFAKALDGTYLFANSAAAAAVGRPGRRVAGLRDADVIPAHLLAAVRAHDERVFAGETITGEEVVEDLGVATRVYLVTKSPMRNAAGQIVGLVAIGRDHTEQKSHERQRELMVNELNHRVKNTLAMVQGLARQNLRHLPAGASAAFEGRLVAMAAAHDVLTRHSWEAAYLDELAAAALRPFRDATAPERIRLQGPRMRLEAKHAVALALALHELATNAVKYGALSASEGAVDVTWWLIRTQAGPHMKLLWAERGGPKVIAPQAKGFGSRLIEQGVSQDLQGRARIEYREQGVLCDITAPLPYGLSPSEGRAG